MDGGKCLVKLCSRNPDRRVTNHSLLIRGSLLSVFNMKSSHNRFLLGSNSSPIVVDLRVHIDLIRKPLGILTVGWPGRSKNWSYLPNQPAGWFGAAFARFAIGGRNRRSFCKLVCSQSYESSRFHCGPEYDAEVWE